MTNLNYRIGIDIGGTCTDCVVLDDKGRATLAKALSTPGDFASGIWDALASAADQLGIDATTLLQRTKIFLHSTTTAENAIVDGNLATVGLLTSSGFGYTLWSTRGGYGRWSGLSEEDKRDLLATDKPRTLVPIPLVREIRERTDRSGRTLNELDTAAVEASVRELLAAGVDAIAVALLWSCVAPGSEERVAQIVKSIAPEMFVCLSSEVSPTIGEYERTSTAVISAAVGPLVSAYLADLESGLRARGFAGTVFVMQSYGGLVAVDLAKTRPASLIESGPVSGLIGCARLGAAIGHDNIVSADMGGTTFKVGSVRNGTVDYQRESMVVRYHLSLPKVDIASFALAGGSIVWRDRVDGVLRVGPKSAGSYPGPVCYGNGGTQPTLTDADAVLGYLNSRYFLGGRRGLDIDAAITAYRHLGDDMGVSAEEAAASVYRISNAMIYDFLHKTTVQRGFDPRRFALVSTGGTAGMHLPAVGEELGVAAVVVPHSASVHGAFGLVTSDVVIEEVAMRPLVHPADPATIECILDELTRAGGQRLERATRADGSTQVAWSVDMRFRRQVHIVTVPLAAAAGRSPTLTADVLEAAVERFEQMYEARYGPGSAYREAGVELVSFRVRVSAGTGHEFESASPVEAKSAQPLDVRKAWIPDEERFDDVSCYDFDALHPGSVVEGPAIIWTPITTIVLTARQRGVLDGLRNMEITTWSK